jgi:hypothetical protein
VTSCSTRSTPPRRRWAASPTPDPAAEGINPANAWAIQTVWFGRVADAVTAELTDRWGDTLAAVDTFTPATVEALAVSLFTDAPVNLP